MSSTFTLVVKPAAVKDIVAAMQWYNQQSPGLGERFLQAIAATYDIIEQDPILFQVRYSGVRVTHLKKYPYSIHFLVDGKRDRVVIIGVFQQKQHPRLWKKRLRGPK